MRILHYSLGFPPFRTGGLTKFCMDLMLEQIREGHDVSLLWPGELRLINKKTIVKNRGFKQVDQYQIGSFEVINPIPVSYDEGISDIALFTKDGDKKAYSDFLDTYTVSAKTTYTHIAPIKNLVKCFPVSFTI